MILLSTYKGTRLAQWVSVSKIRIPEQVLVAIDSVCEHEACVTGSPATTL